MASITAIQSGLARFIDRDIAPGLTGWNRVLIAGGGGILASRLPQLLDQFADRPLLAALGVYDRQNGSVDIDTLYQAASPYIGTEPLPVKIPYIGITMKIGKKDIDSLYSCIREVEGQ